MTVLWRWISLTKMSSGIIFFIPRNEVFSLYQTILYISSINMVFLWHIRQINGRSRLNCSINKNILSKSGVTLNVRVLIGQYMRDTRYTRDLAQMRDTRYMRDLAQTINRQRVGKSTWVEKTLQRFVCDTPQNVACFCCFLHDDTAWRASVEKNMEQIVHHARNSGHVCAKWWTLQTGQNGMWAPL